MRITSIPAIVLLGSLGAASLPAFAQTETTGQSATGQTVVVETPAMVIMVPDGFTVTPITAVTVDELRGAKVYDVEGNPLAEIKDLGVDSNNLVTSVVADFGGYLGFSERLIALSPEQIHIYKNEAKEVRAFVTMSKDELAAMPVQTAN